MKVGVIVVGVVRLASSPLWQFSVDRVGCTLFLLKFQIQMYLSISINHAFSANWQNPFRPRARFVYLVSLF